MNPSTSKSPNHSHADRANHRLTAKSLFALALAVATVGPAWGEPMVNVNTGGHLAGVSHFGSCDVSTHVDRTSAQIAERIKLTLEVRSPAGVQVSFPAKPDRLGEFQVVAVHDILDIPSDSGGRLSTRVYELECLISGEQTIPAVSLSLLDSNEGDVQPKTIQSQPVAIAIRSLLEGQTDLHQFRDIKGIVPLDPPATRNFIGVAVAAGFGALLAGLGLAWVVMRRRRSSLSPAAWALHELELLENHSDVETVDIQSFYTQLTNIVRVYVEDEFRIAASRLTTAEFFDRAQQSKSLDPCHVALLREFLDTADMVKFAGLLPDRQAFAAACSKARQFVEESSATATPQEIA